MDNWAELITLAVVVLSAVAGLVVGLINLVWIVFALRSKTLKNQEDIGEIRANRKEDRKDIHGIFLRLTAIETILTERGAMQSNSPKVFNETGLEISKGVNAPDLAKKYLPSVKVPESADNLMIQEMSVSYASNRLMDEADAKDRQSIRDYAFYSGHSMPSVLVVIGYEMRNIILSERDPEAFKMVSRGLGKKKAGKKRVASSKAA